MTRLIPVALILATTAVLAFAALRSAPHDIPAAGSSGANTVGTASGNLATRTGAPDHWTEQSWPSVVGPDRQFGPAASVAAVKPGPAAPLPPRLPIPGRGGITTLAAEAAGRLAAPTLRPSPFRRVQSVRPLIYGPTRSGIASTYGAGWSEHWVALPDGPGWRFRVCGAGGCRELVSTDAGPDLAMQRVGRVVDLPPGAFAAVCGVPVSAGLCNVVVTILGRA